MSKTKHVCIAGATGFVGIELIKLLVKHPNIKIKYIFGNEKKIFNKFLNKKIIKNDKKLPKLNKLNINNINKCDVLFSALPHGILNKIANKINSNIVIIDLSADFRLTDVKEFQKWYKTKHQAKNLQKCSIYGLSEIFYSNIKKNNIIACPGCYPTSLLLPLIPLLDENLINTQEIIADCKSGYSGAGKKIFNKKKYPNIDNNISVYGIANHRHLPEIEEYLKKFCKTKLKINFTPHLIPTFRGIISTIYIKSKYNISKLYNKLDKYYKESKFIRVYKNKELNTNDVINTNYCNISINQNRFKNEFIISCSIDNLLKGASGQAIQNFNIRFGFKETKGLI